jgi:hypothetical protein
MYAVELRTTLASLEVHMTANTTVLETRLPIGESLELGKQYTIPKP